MSDEKEFTLHPSIEEIIEKVRDVLDKKGADYSGRDDVLRNFRESAKEANISFEQVWLVFFKKQFDAIRRYIRDGRVESEPIEERIKDAMAYLALLYVRVRELEQENVKSKSVPILEGWTASHIQSDHKFISQRYSDLCAVCDGLVNGHA